METFYIPNEHDLKKWIKEAVKETLQDSLMPSNYKEVVGENLMNRKEISNFLRISLVTLADWMKRGLPFHKQRGRVYFMKSEIMAYIKDNKARQLKFGDRFQNIRKEFS